MISQFLPSTSYSYELQLWAKHGLCSELSETPIKDSVFKGVQIKLWSLLYAVHTSKNNFQYILMTNDIQKNICLLSSHFLVPFCHWFSLVWFRRAKQLEDSFLNTSFNLKGHPHRNVFCPKWLLRKISSFLKFARKFYLLICCCLVQQYGRKAQPLYDTTLGYNSSWLNFARETGFSLAQ